MSKLKKCKSCEKEVAKSVKVCPNCGEKLKGSFIIGLAKLLFFLFSMMIIIKLVSDDSGGSSSASKLPPSKIKEVTKTKKFEITVIGVRTARSVGTEFYAETASQGAQFISVWYKYKNISNKPLSSYTFPKLSLEDNNGTEYKLASAATLAESQNGDNANTLSDLNPGITSQAVTVFEVSKELYDPVKWKILVDADKDFYVNLK